MIRHGVQQNDGRHRAPPASRRGEVLVEFAFISLVLYLLLAGIIEFGRALFAAQVLQQSVDTAARELSRMPLPPTGTLTGPTGALATNPTAKQQVYDEGFLVFDLATLPANQPLADYFAQNAPILNRMLLPLMIFETHDGKNLVHYPGQLVANANTPTGMTVVIPIVQYTKGTGLLNPSTDAIITTIPVVEEITPQAGADLFNPDPTWSPFNLLATNLPPSQRGLIALRINYPFQAATLSAYTVDASGQQAPVVTGEDGDFGPYAGADGLGRLAALGKTVRPFRKVLSAQAIFRREIFE